MSEPAALLDVLDALRADLARAEAAREERDRAIAAELAELRAVTRELARRRARNAAPPGPSQARPEVKAKVHAALARARAKEGQG